MRKALLLLAAIAGIFPATVEAKKAPKPVWQVTRTTDPLTGATSCVVAAVDTAAGMSFTRMGALYPIVENNSVHGLLVGVSSGGRFRLPTGDIQWRVDDHPLRVLRAADNPTGAATSSVPSGTMQQLADQQMKLIAAATATSTLVSGAAARAMLDEMLAGKGLIFRAAAAANPYGLPGEQQAAVGQATKGGLRPYPLDDSFHAGVAACGIG